MSWIPRSPHDEVDGMVWLPRLVEKARRAELSRTSNADLMNGYLYGDNDYIDAQVLRFLRIDDCALSQLVAEYGNDLDVARVVILRSGRTLEERRAFSASLERRLMRFVLLDADEGRLGRGFRRSAIAFAYNRVMMPVINVAFRRAERRRVRREERSGAAAGAR